MGQQAAQQLGSIYGATPPRGVSIPPNPSDIDYDPPLIQCIATLFKLNGKPVSTKLLVAGLASQDGEISPSACLRSARNAGLQCKTVYRPDINSISKMTLPCILLLKDGRACVLTRIEGVRGEILLPETDLQPRSIAMSDLQEDYIGYAIYAKPDVVLDRRASNIKLLNSKRWFWDTFFNFMPMYSHVFLGSIVINLLTIAGPLFFMNVYDRVVPHKAISTLWVLAIGYATGLTFDFIIRNLRSFFTDAAGRNADIVLASKIMQQLLSIRLDNKPDSTGSLVNNIREFESLREFFSSTTLLALIDLPFLIIFLIIVSYIGGVISIVAWVAVPVIVGVGIYLQYPLQTNTEKSFKENMQKNALLVEIVNGLETVKTSMAEGKVQDRWEKIVGESARSMAQNKRLSNFSMTFTMFASQIVSVSLIIWGIYQIKEGALTQGALIGANMLVGRAMAPLSQIASMFSRLQQSRMSLKALDVLMTLPTERIEPGSYVEFGHLEHSIALENVSFKYPNSERLALDGVNIKIKPGEKVGIIGRMGSGKSTLGRLIVGLYQPTEGAIKFGGVDIRQMDTSELRSRVGYLSQDNYLFYGTVRENIAFGVVNADDRMILRAANISGVTDFVRGHPAGFGMPVGERGMALSGGQRQSVAIARSLLHDPDVLILDEPSSNMDNSSELALKQRLAGTLGSKTVLLITHRLSMLDIVDRLIIIDGGKVVADGPKKTVLNSLTSNVANQKNLKTQTQPINAATNAPQEGHGTTPRPANVAQGAGE
ncbi:type I secretion system permease/ATPase [Desulfovibrio litoralis]